jgi:DNA-directed RNA polymerase subunit RPC12/RpoP
MPNYVFKCVKCAKVYEDLVSFDPTGKYQKVKCPNCKSRRKLKMPTTCSEVIFTNPRGTRKADSFSYVAGHNMAQAKDERRKAEAASHMGAAPYRAIDDISSGVNFGEVK